jgi:uncharacterized protein (TIGR02231 family)
LNRRLAKCEDLRCRQRPAARIFFLGDVTMLVLPLLFSLADPTPVASKIQEVTLYAGSALVRREARLPGSGAFVLQGLPFVLDKNNVRVRCEGGDVANVEVRERVLDKAPNERMQALRDRLAALHREMKVLEDDVAVIQAMREHLQQLMKLDLATHSSDVQAGKSSVESWGASYDFINKRIVEVTNAAREAQWKIEDKQNAIAAVEAELGKIKAGGAVHVYDVVADVVAGGASLLEVEYFVGSTGWQPAYDLHAAKDLSKVELVYRAKIWQQTSEDWNDVDINLSTARPQKGARGPELSPIWLSILQPVARASRELASESALDGAEARRAGAKGRYRGPGDAVLSGSDDYFLGNGPASGAPNAPPPRPFASVQSEGLSVRFKLARRETIESRELPTTVLVGTGDLAIAPERYTAPSLDPTVWLRARTRNTSQWAILPGTAAVFFGADFLGNAELETVQPGQELTLALGADPGVTVTRTQTEDMKKGPGFLSSKSSKIDGWRIHLENHGTVGANGDGSVDVIVREVLPRAKDERIDVEISRADPKPSTDERWKQDAEEKGIQTWIVRVPKDGKSDVVFQTTIDYPKGAELVRN